MLLSMYFSYRWANYSKKTYVFRTVVFVVLSSLSALFSISRSPVSIFFFPLIILSFPLYAYTYEILFEHVGWEPFLGIRFFPIGSTHPIGLRHTFLFFLFVNVVGAVSGYAISRIRIQEWGTVKTWGLSGFILTTAFVGVGGLFRGIFIDKSSEIIYVVTRYLGYGANYFDGVVLFFYGITVLAIVIGKIILSWSKIPDEHQA